jgi:hypothetical protein
MGDVARRVFSYNKGEPLRKASNFFSLKPLTVGLEKYPCPDKGLSWYGGSMGQLASLFSLASDFAGEPLNGAIGFFFP